MLSLYEIIRTRHFNMKFNDRVLGRVSPAIPFEIITFIKSAIFFLSGIKIPTEEKYAIKIFCSEVLYRGVDREGRRFIGNCLWIVSEKGGMKTIIWKNNEPPIGCQFWLDFQELKDNYSPTFDFNSIKH